MVRITSTLVGALLLAGCSSHLTVGHGSLVKVSATPNTATSPSTADIDAQLRRIHEADYPRRSFHSLQFATTTGADRTVFTAVSGLPDPTADGKGQIVAFWRGSTFVGLALPVEVAALSDVRPAGPGQFVVSVENYRSTDPLCCPSGQPRTIERTYTWNGAAFVVNAPWPASVTAFGGGVSVVVTR